MSSIVPSGSPDKTNVCGWRELRWESVIRNLRCPWQGGPSLSGDELATAIEAILAERGALRTQAEGLREADRQWREGCAMHGSCRVAQIQHEMGRL